MSYTPKVSIVIPAYNASNYLAEAIESALAQTYANFEVIVVNDGSEDGGATRSIAQAYGESIRYIEKSNGGSSSALNAGIENMSGEWFSWLSHDDLYLPDKLERQINLLNGLCENGTSIENNVIFGAYELIDKLGRRLYKPSLRSRKRLADAVNGIESNIFLIAEAGSRFTFHGCSCLINRKVFDAVGIFDEKLREVNDVDMWKRIFESNLRVHYIPEITVKGRVHSEQVSAAIGYSYHTPEQDLYWGGLLRVLTDMDASEENRKQALLSYTESAYGKTRKSEAKIAFSQATDGASALEKTFMLAGFLLFALKSDSFNAVKKLYRRLSSAQKQKDNG